MLNVWDDQLVVDEKGIYSIEKFLIARRLMYWQVYLHRTVVSSEQVLVQLLNRAQELSKQGKQLFATPALDFFLNAIPATFDQDSRKIFLDHFAALDDHDIITSAKVWCNHSDTVLSLLSRGLINRELFSVELNDQPSPAERVTDMREKVARRLSIPLEEAIYLVVSDSVSNYAYTDMDDRITILDKMGNTRDIALASDMLNISVLSKTVRKYFLCYPRFMKDLS
jgi:HD superfamily phosphohydrolase